MADNIIDDNNNKKKTRKNKKLFFHEQRNQILHKLIQLINFNDEKSVLLAQLKDNMELKNYLISVVDDIKKYYRCSTWGYFVSINNGEIGDEITLLKAIFKDHDYRIFSKDITAEYNNVKKRYTTLFFTK